MMSSSRKSYTRPAQFIIIMKTNMVRKRLNISPKTSDSGKKKEGIFNAFINPEEPIILATDWLVELEKKNQKIRPDVTYKT